MGGNTRPTSYPSAILLHVFISHDGSSWQTPVESDLGLCLRSLTLMTIGNLLVSPHLNNQGGFVLGFLFVFLNTCVGIRS